MIENFTTHWFIQALGIAILASAALNGAQYLPALRILRPTRIEARWVGYMGLTIALWVWAIPNLDQPTWKAGVAWIVICLMTLVPNTLVHFYRRDEEIEREHLLEHQQILLENLKAELLDAKQAVDVASQRDEIEREHLSKHQQILLENAKAELLDAMQAIEVAGLMVWEMYDPRYAREYPNESDHNGDFVLLKRKTRTGAGR